jgi:two-component system, CAI-1 autoinducer sensor kinase/phosphatase CqsS
MPLRGRTVLIVDDDHDSRDTTRRMLEGLGARVVEAPNGLEALHQLDRQEIHLVLCDIEMPIMNGLEFATRTRQDPRYLHLQLVAVTALQNAADIRRIWDAGFDGHIQKPTTFDALFALGHRLTGGSDVAEPVA